MKKKLCAFLVTVLMMLIPITSYADAVSSMNTVLANTKSSSRPFSEFDDPVNMAEEFSESFEGKVQAFINSYGEITTKSKLWTSVYEQCLLDLLSDESFVKEFVFSDDSKVLDVSSSVIKEIADNCEKKGAKYATGGLADISTVVTGFLNDRLKPDLKNDLAKISVLEDIRDNTSDSNLSAACINCINSVYTNTVDKIEAVVFDALKDVGLDSNNIQKITKGNFIKKVLKESGIKKLSAVLGGISSAVSIVDKILLIKDLVSYTTGIDKRVESYMNNVALTYVYEAASKSYGKVIGKLKKDKKYSGEAYTLYMFMLSLKKQQYNELENMFTSSKWKKYLKSDPYLKSNYDTVKNLTATNYTKKTLQKQTPSLEQSSIKLVPSAISSVPVENVRFDAKITYKVKNDRIAEVTSNGVIKAKKKGSTQINITVKQYGHTYKLKFDVEVVDAKDTSITLNKKKAVLDLYSNNKITLKATVVGKNQNVSWESNNKKVATVSKNGLVKAVGSGSATITASANGKTAKCSIIVERPSGIEISEYFQYDVQKATAKLGVKKSDQYTNTLFYCNGDYPENYTIMIECSESKKDIAGGWNCTFMSSNYSLYGAKVGMSESEFMQVLNNSVFKFSRSSSFQVADGSTMYYYIFQYGGRTIRLYCDDQKVCDNISYY